MRISAIGRTAHTAATCVRACAPAPITARMDAPGTASNSVARPEAAPVRSAVRMRPSISASGSPVWASVTRTAA